MRNKKFFSFDEEKDAKEIIANGFPNSTIDYSAMYTIAKYFRQTLRYGAIRLERELIKFCKAQDTNFNPITDAESIKKWVVSAMNYDLRKIESVTVSQKEIDFLKTIENNRDRKLLFTALIFSKIIKHRGTRHKKKDFKVSDNYYIHYNNFPDIIKFSGLKNISEIDLADIFGKYTKYMTVYHAEKELIRLNFIDKNPTNTTLILLKNSLLDYYDLFFGKNQEKGVCSKCGDFILKTNNSQKYCANCAREIKNEKDKARMKQKRAKQ